MDTAPALVEVFCAYASADEVWLRKLETHLSLLKRQGLISLWHDRLILPSTDWARAIDTHLETASVILLLVSADFFASDYCTGREMKRALEREVAGKVRVIPILVRPVDWNDAPFVHLQVLPTDARSLSLWPDEDAALADVTAGIRRVIVEERLQVSSHTSHATLPPIWNVPYPRNPFFLGRDEELSQIRHHLQDGQATALSQPQAICGLGGIGKTQLALEYAYRYHRDYQSVLWAYAESTEALTASYVALAQLLQLPERKAKKQEIIVQAVKNWLQTHRDWLLILDNADELALLSDFLPPSLGGHLLLTTRAAATRRLAYRLEIETLRPEAGALFLLRRAGHIAPDATLEQASSQEQEMALQISQELGGLPLALDQAGAYLEETGTDLGEYWSIYQQHRAEVLMQRRGLVNDHPAPVATTWLLSFEKVGEKNPAATDLLRVCAYLSPDAIPEEIFVLGASLLGSALATVATNALLLNQAIETLRAYSLVRRDPAGKTLSVHRLVQAVLQDSLAQAERDVWAERTMLAVNASFPENVGFPYVEHSTWPQYERLLTHALLAAQRMKPDQVSRLEAAQLLYQTAGYLRERARYSESELLFQRALAIQERQLEPEHLDVGISLYGLAILYRQEGKYAEAEPLYHHALRIFERQLGSEHHHVALVLASLGSLRRDQGRYEEAESFLQRALPILEQQLGSEHSDVALVLTSLGDLRLNQDRYVKAEPFYQRAQLIWNQQLGSEHPHIARYVLNYLASIYAGQGKYVEAEALCQRALHILERQLGPEHHYVANSLVILADVYSQQGKYEEAEALYQRALHILEQQLGSERPDVAECLNNLANLYRNQGKYVHAEPHYQRALQICEQTLGPQHPQTAKTMHDFAQLREAQGNSEEARAWYEQALLIREQVFGVHHPKTMETRKHLITLLHAMGQHEEAARLEAIQSELS